MSKQHSLTEALLIAGRKTTIVDEVLRGADVNTQVVYGDTSHGFRPERRSVIVRDGHCADEYEISAADFRRLRAMGVLAEAEQVSSQAACVARPCEAHKAPAGGLSLGRFFLRAKAKQLVAGRTHLTLSFRRAGLTL